MRRILRASKLPILGKAPSGETPLHLSVSWPRGAHLLFELGGNTTQSIIEVEDSDGATPLDYALSLRQHKTIQIILDEGSIIDLEDTQNIEVVYNVGHQRTQSEEVICLLSQRLAYRRTELTSFALGRLPQYEISRIGLRMGQMIQEEAFEVVETLQKLLIIIPEHIRGALPGTIYHSREMSVTLASELFKAGFERANLLFHGFSPLMTVSFRGLDERRGLEGTLGLVTWFLDHGADLNCPIPWVACTMTPSSCEPRRYQAIHRVAEEMGFSNHVSRTPNNEESHLALLCRILGDSTVDPCNCYCAPQGCSPSSLFSRSMWTFFVWSNVPKKMVTGWHDHPLQSGVMLIQLATSPHKMSVKVIMAIIRLSTFTRLGMKNTCCSYNECHGEEGGSPTEEIRDGEYQIVEIMDPDEIEEIQEEDRYLALRLDALVEEFEAKFVELDQPFSEFFWGYWWSRMNEIDAEKEELSHEDIGAIQDTGFVLETE